MFSLREIEIRFIDKILAVFDMTVATVDGPIPWVAETS
jgi:hypothetical protein